MLLIYTPAITNRLLYIAEVLFTRVIPVEYDVTQSMNDYSACTDPKINYSAQRFCKDELWIKPHGLLFEIGIKEQETACSEWLGLKVFFTTGGDVPFDFFAASFYLITRYEEYLHHEKDIYGRYAHTNSMAYKEGFLHLPLVNLWMKELEQIIKNKFTIHHSRFTIHHSPFAFLPTYDIDIAYAYKGKGLLRSVGGFCKDLFTLKWGQVIERLGIYSGLYNDPFDTYAWLDELHGKYQLMPVYFFLLAAQNRLYDKNIAPHKKCIQQLIRQHASKYQVGIHPSWQSGDNENILDDEITVLESIISKPVVTSRQHYIRMDMPATYRLLIKKGITQEYSMGYGSTNGFRASVALPFCWYDVENDVKTNLLIRPFCFMDANSFFEQHYTAEQAATELQQYHDIVKAVSGQLITIFHNHFVTRQPQWVGWRNMYAEFLLRNFGE